LFVFALFTTHLVACSSCGEEENAYTGWQKTEDPERDAYPLSDLILASLDARPGMRIADVGAGYGYFAFKLANIVGRDGVVIASDTEAELVDVMSSYTKTHDLKNVQPMLVDNRHTGFERLPKHYFDRILMVGSLAFSGPVKREKIAILKEFRRVLDPDGFVLLNNGGLGNTYDHFLAAGFSGFEKVPCPGMEWPELDEPKACFILKCLR